MSFCSIICHRLCEIIIGHLITYPMQVSILLIAMQLRKLWNVCRNTKWHFMFWYILAEGLYTGVRRTEGGQRVWGSSDKISNLQSFFVKPLLKNIFSSMVHGMLERRVKDLFLYVKTTTYILILESKVHIVLPSSSFKSFYGV